MISGANLIASRESKKGAATFRSIEPTTGRQGLVDFHEATADETAEAAESAASASEDLRTWSPLERAALLRSCADALEGAGDQLVDNADRETGLGRARLEGELARTVGQFRGFARFVETGLHLDPIIDFGEGENPDVRRTVVPVGPVGVFGASNFPMAFSVPGGDTASALAAGCPVVIKAHPSHPATSELCARALSSAIEVIEGPPGTISLLQGRSNEVGRALVMSDHIKAIGFTGSHSGGRALHDLAATRHEPIPVFAEMGSLNPVFVSPRSLIENEDAVALGFAQSMTLGGGQFCTKPGLVVVPPGASGESFVKKVAGIIAGQASHVLLNDAIARAFEDRMRAIEAIPGVRVVVGPERGGPAGLHTTAGLISTDVDTLLRDDLLMSEHFGPVSVIVFTDLSRYGEVAAALEGTLTATIHAAHSEIGGLSGLLADLADRAGRIVWNGFPTGVAVVPAMMHGGPFPATTNTGQTSVGATAMRRFQRPVAYQNVPNVALPPALRNENPLGIWRMVNSRWTRAAIHPRA